MIFIECIAIECRTGQRMRIYSLIHSCVCVWHVIPGGWVWPGHKSWWRLDAALSRMVVPALPPIVNYTYNIIKWRTADIMFSLLYFTHDTMVTEKPVLTDKEGSGSVAWGRGMPPSALMAGKPCTYLCRSLCQIMTLLFFFFFFRPVWH